MERVKIAALFADADVFGGKEITVADDCVTYKVAKNGKNKVGKRFQLFNARKRKL